MHTTERQGNWTILAWPYTQGQPCFLFFWCRFWLSFNANIRHLLFWQRHVLTPAWLKQHNILVGHFGGVFSQKYHAKDIFGKNSYCYIIYMHVWLLSILYHKKHNANLNDVVFTWACCLLLCCVYIKCGSPSDVHKILFHQQPVVDQMCYTFHKVIILWRSICWYNKKATN